MPYQRARADRLRRLGRRAEAMTAYRRAHELATNAAERQFLARCCSRPSQLGAKSNVSEK